MKSSLVEIESRIEVKENKTEGILNYDTDNAYAQRVENIRNSSGTATLCSDMMAKFIFGEGWADENLAKLVINRKGVTANQLLRKYAKSISTFNGFAIQVNYNALFEKVEFNNVPFENLRFTTPDNEEHPNMLAVYNDWGKIKSSRIQKKNIDYVNFYDPRPEVIQAQVDAAGGWHKYKGQILYWTPEGIEYPLCPFDSVIEDVQTDSQAKIFKNKNIRSNFMASHILRVGAFEDAAARNEFKEDIKGFTGAENASSMLVLEGKSDEDNGFDLEKVDIQNVENLYEFTETSARDNIIRNFLIPPVLLLATPGKLGSSSEIKDATALYNGQTSDYRMALSETFKDLLSGFNAIEYEYDITNKQADTVDFKETSEGKEKVLEILINPAIEDVQKERLLTNLYGYTEEKAKQLING